MNWPFALVTVVETVPLASWVAVTVTPGSTPPELSVTDPTMAPVSVCAAAGVRPETSTRNRAMSVAGKARGKLGRMRSPPPVACGPRTGDGTITAGL